MVVQAISLNVARSSDPELATPRTQPSKIRMVLLATDLTGASQVATEQAIDLAASIGARLLIVNVIAPREPGDTGPMALHPTIVRLDQQRASREGPLLKIVERARARRLDAAFLLWVGEPGKCIVAAA